ncbi:MAG TPA: hypothetical protein VF680_00415 [Allosphingosinicella sp.]|jgi:hypothetical protein
MANVAPPRFVRLPGSAGEEGFGATLREAFGARQDRLPQWLEQALARLRGRL